MGEQTKAERRAAFARDAAPGLAEAAGAPTASFESKWSLSKRFAFTADDDVLALVATPEESELDASKGLAYGLAHRGDRDLVLVLREGTEWPTLARLPWLDLTARVFTYDKKLHIAPKLIPSRAEVLGGYTDPLETSEHQLGERAAWVDRLVAWAEDDVDLEPAHRKSYLAWHCQGRMVLKIRRAKKGLAVSGGVQYSKGPDFVEHIEEPLSSAQVHRLIAAASAATAERLDGADVTDAENRLQSVLAGHRRTLGLTHMEREFPAFRPSGGRGYVDFLATDSKGRVHVVETKIGNDEMLVLQGLDYWIWAQAHRNELGGYLQLDDRPAVVIDYVVAGDHGKHPVGPYSAPQAEALDRSIEWRFHVVEEWHDPDTPPTVATLPKRTAPDLPRITGRPFALRTQDRLAIRADGELYGGVLHADPTAGIHPAAMSTYESLDAAGLLHNMVHHVRSSQAFAINLFGPFDAEGAARLLRLAGVDVVDAESPQLEYVERDDRLGEVLYSKHPHQTQVDVFMKGTDRNGQVHGLLIEVKLTETDFGHCSAYQNPKNDALEVCAAVGGFGGDSERCFQLRNHGGSKRRSYDEFLGVVSPAPNPCGCVFRLGINQPMRNVALAGVLLDGNEIDVAHYALCAPRAHAAIWRRWAEAKTVLGTGRVNMFDLPADTVIALHDQPTALWLDGKYGHPTRESLGWHLACELYARHPGRFHLIETHPGGGQYDCLTLCDRDDLQLRVDINRVGSLHVAGLEELVSMAEVWDRLSAGRLGEVVQWCEQVIGEGRDASSDAAWVRIMSRLADELGHVARWQSGYLDSSGDEGGVRSGLFDAMPVVAEACRPERDDLIGEAAYRFWFLVDTTGRPIAAIELSSGSGWNIAGARFDLCTEAHDFVDQVEASIN